MALSIAACFESITDVTVITYEWSAVLALSAATGLGAVAGISVVTIQRCPVLALSILACLESITGVTVITYEWSAVLALAVATGLGAITGVSVITVGCATTAPVYEL